MIDFWKSSVICFSMSETYFFLLFSRSISLFLLNWSKSCVSCWSTTSEIVPFIFSSTIFFKFCCSAGSSILPKSWFFTYFTYIFSFFDYFSFICLFSVEFFDDDRISGFLFSVGGSFSAPLPAPTGSGTTITSFFWVSFSIFSYFSISSFFSFSYFSCYYLIFYSSSSILAFSYWSRISLSFNFWSITFWPETSLFFLIS